MLKFLLIIAILIQAVAAVFALRLVRTTKYNSVWILFIIGFFFEYGKPADRSPPVS